MAVTEAATLEPSRDGRLASYALIALGGVGGALVVGQPAFVGLALPFALALALGLRRTGPVQVKASVELDAEQVVEGDDVTGRIVLEWEGEFEAEVLLHRMHGVEPASAQETSWSFPEGSERVEIPVELRTLRWGRHGVGEVWVRLTTRFGLLYWTGKLVPEPSLRILPRKEKLDRLLEPPESRAVWGGHLSRRLGDGHDFAELRPYAPGDRMRDLNWTATARRGRPFVNRYHPELAGEVIVVLDAFWDGSRGSAEALARAARVSWAVISVHRQENDRVGLAGLGGSTHWLPPGGGRFARYRLMETLLRIGSEAGAGRTASSAFHPAATPASALIMAVTPLADEGTLHTLRAWRGRGRSVVVSLVDTAEHLGEPASPSEGLARRIWSFELARRKEALAEVGIPAAAVPPHQPVTQVIAALRHMRRAPSLRSGR